jgi:hypothetical protein
MAKTTCDWTVERLPWWATGTLEEGEGESVREHLDDCDSCRQEMAATRRALALHALHLPVETLLDLVEDGAAESFRTAEGEVLSRAAVDAHLGHCASCRQELSLLRESRAAVEAGPDEVGTVTAFAPRRATADAEPARGRRFDRRLMALAASVAIAVVAAGGWLGAGRTVERQEELLAEYGRRLEAAEAAAGEPAASESGARAGDAALATALAEERAEADRLREELERREEEAGRADAADRIASAVSVGSTITWNVELMRGDAGGGGPLIAPPGTPALMLHVTGFERAPERLVVEDASGRRPVELPVELYDSALGRHLSITLRLGDLPEGRLRLRLLAGDDELASNWLIVEH